MTLLKIDAKYRAAADECKFNAVFGGHPRQLEAAAAMFNAWPAIKEALLAANKPQPSFIHEGDTA